MAGEQRIKLVSLNIELDRHLERVVPFLRKENPDVVCLQEVLEKNLATLKDALLMEGDFVAGCILDTKLVNDIFVIDEELMKKGPEGLTLLTKLPTLSSGVEYYLGSNKEIPRWSIGHNRMLLSATVKKGEKVYTIGATHFTWTPDGQASLEQKRDMKRFLEILGRFPDVVFCGDFNAPRGGEMWEELAKEYKDNIPAMYRSSLDPTLHRAGHLAHVVDGLFSTPEYLVSDVRLVEGVSDHKAIVGFIERV